MKLDDTMLMYGIYNAETLEKLINTVYEIHNATSSHERLFAGEHNHSLLLYDIPLQINGYTGNNTTKHHSRSMGDNRDLTGVFHQKVSSLPMITASDSRSFQSS